MDDRTGPGYIYLLKRHDGWYRIGRTANPKARFTQWRWLAKNNRYRLKPILLIAVSNQIAVENFFHTVFDCKRTEHRWHGMGPRHEWFRLDRYDLKAFWRWAFVVGRIYQMHESWTLPAEVPA